jgi:hypothetical protein
VVKMFLMCMPIVTLPVNMENNRKHVHSRCVRCGSSDAYDSRATPNNNPSGESDYISPHVPELKILIEGDTLHDAPSNGVIGGKTAVWISENYPAISSIEP